MNIPSGSLVDAPFNTWYQQLDPRADFLSRLAGRSTFAPVGRKTYDIDTLNARSLAIGTYIVGETLSEDDTMSTISTTATQALPALTGGSSTSSSTGTADTGLASGLDGGYVLESQDGVLTVPNRFQPDADLLCPFQILDCQQAFSDIVDFKTHVFSHFKGHSVPTKASCFLCDMKFSQDTSDHATMAWHQMLSHLADDHFRQGQRLATVRTDFTLMRWMYCRRIIDDAQFKRIQMCPIPTVLPTSRLGEIVNIPMAPHAPPASRAGSSRGPYSVLSDQQNEAFTVSASRRADRRRREATRPFVSARGNL